MTNIKPPTGPSSLLPPEPSPTDGPDGPTGPGLGRLVEAEKASAAAAPDHVPTDAIVEQLRSGALTQQQAVDALVERALSEMGPGLSVSQRQDLAETLRSALANDPTLLALQAELGA